EHLVLAVGLLRRLRLARLLLFLDRIRIDVLLLLGAAERILSFGDDVDFEVRTRDRRFDPRSLLLLLGPLGLSLRDRRLCRLLARGRLASRLLASRLLACGRLASVIGERLVARGVVRPSVRARRRRVVCRSVARGCIGGSCAEGGSLCARLGRL